MEEQNIVAIDLGTSKISLTVARKDGKTAEVIYYAKTPSEGIARGAVQNTKKAAEAINRAIEQAEETLRVKITGCVVGMPKYAITRKSTSVEMDRDDSSCIEEDEIKALRQSAIDSCTLDRPETESVLEAVPQSFSDEETFQMTEDEIIGRTSSHMEGRYDLYIGSRKCLGDIDRAFMEKQKVCGTKFFPGLAAARAVLTEDEMDSGVALVDMGAGATSVSIFKDGIMRWYDSIPFGGNLVTKDIRETCHLSESLAENIKKAYGVCLPERLAVLSDKILQIRGDNVHPGCELQVKFLSKVITARMIEIIDAVLYMIQESGYADKISSGIVLTGGVSRTCNCWLLVKERSGLNVRIGYPRKIFTVEGMVDGINYPEASASVGMLLMAKDINYTNCTIASEDFEEEEAGPVEGDLSTMFNEEDEVPGNEPAGDTDGERKEREAREREHERKEQERRAEERRLAEERRKAEELNRKKKKKEEKSGFLWGFGEKFKSALNEITEEKNNEKV